MQNMCTIKITITTVFTSDEKLVGAVKDKPMYHPGVFRGYYRNWTDILMEKLKQLLQLRRKN